MLTILELAKESGKTLLEIYAQVPNSFEAYRSQISNALSKNPPTEVQNAEYCWLEGCVGEFPEKILFEAVMKGDDDGKYTRKYYQSKVGLDEAHQIVFTDTEEVETVVVIKAKNDMKQLSETYTPENVKVSEFDETIDATFELDALTEADARSGKKRTAKVKVAQESDKKNKNGRVYPKDVMREAVVNAQGDIKKYNGLLMDSQHRVDADGKNLTNLRETVAVIKQIEFNEADGTVSLPKVEFVNTQAGKDLVALLESGIKLQVSQRGEGTAHTVWDPDTNESYQKVNHLRIRGIDIVAPGTASVADAYIESHNEQQSGGESQSSQNGGGSGQEDPTAEGTELPTNRNTGGGNGGGSSDPPQPAQLSEEDKRLLTDMQRTLDTQQSTLTETQQQLKSQADESERKAGIAHLKIHGTTILDEEIEALLRFNEEQKQLLKDDIHVTSYYNEIMDVYSEESIRQVLKPAIHKAAQRLDKIIAASRLQEMGFPTDMQTGIANRQQGQTRVSVIHENMPGAELHHKTTHLVIEKIKKESERDVWLMPLDHPYMDILESVMNTFMQAHYSTLMNEDVQQSDIGGRIATIAAMVIPTAWRLTTAFQVVDIEPMPNRVLDKKIRIQAQGNPTNTDFLTQYANLDPGENGNIQEVNISYLNYPMYATRQALRSTITPNAIATARNTPMQPLVDTVMDIAMDIKNRVDMALWWLHIVRGLLQGKTEVTTWTSLTRVGTSNVYRSAHRAWIPYVWEKTTDTQGNPDVARFAALAPASGQSAAPTGLGTQGIELQAEHSGTVTALLQGTDYTIDYQSGAITLTTAGEGKRNTLNAAALIQAKYTYSTNVSTWSMTPPSGTTLAAHLLSLRRAVGQRRVKVIERNWQPNFVGFNYDIEDLITMSDRMTDLGGTVADVLNALNQVVNYAGLQPVKSTALPSGWIPVGMQGAVCHGVHTPWSFGAPIINEQTNKKTIIGEQFRLPMYPSTTN